MKYPCFYLLVSLTVCACSQAERADKQVQRQVTLPQFDDQKNKPLSLAGDSGSFNFIGSLILWDIGVTPEQIQKISETSRDSRMIKSAMVSAKEGIHEARRSLTNAENALGKLNREIEEAMARGDQSSGQVRSVLLPVVGDWFENRVTELKTSQSISASDQAHAENMFAAYCEVKLWELALSPLATASFADRPTPVAMCESYYTGRQYFQNADLCAAPGAGTRRNYFECLWNEGVLLSPLFVEKLNSTPCRPRANPADFASRGEAIKAWVKSGLMQRVLADNEVITGRGTYAEEFVSQSWSGSPYIPQLFSKEVAGVAVYSDLGRCRIAFKRADLAADQVIETDDLWKFGKFESLKFIVETQSVSGMEFQLLPSTGDLNRDKRNYDKLAHYINAFSVRNAKNNQYLVSYSDAKFNQPSGLLLKADFEQSKAIEADPAFAAFAKARRHYVSEDVWTLQGMISADIQAAKEEVANLDETYQANIYQRFVTNQSDSISAVSDPGANVLFNSFALNLSRKAGVLQVEVKFSESVMAAKGCFDFANTGGCSKTVSDHNAGVHFDSEAGRLTVTMKLVHPGDLGFMRRTKSDLFPYFSQIDEQLLFDQDLIMEFDLNRLNDNLDFFTGTTYIRDRSGQELFRGSQSGDNVSQALSELDETE